MRCIQFYVPSAGETKVRASKYQAEPGIEVEVVKAPRWYGRVIHPIVTVSLGHVYASFKFGVVCSSVRYFPVAGHVVIGGSRLKVWEVTGERLAEMEEHNAYERRNDRERWVQRRNTKVFGELRKILEAQGRTS